MAKRVNKSGKARRPRGRDPQAPETNRLGDFLSEEQRKKIEVVKSFQEQKRGIKTKRR